MKSFLACLLLALACASVLADDYESCKNDFKSFLGCLKSEFDKKSDADKAKAKQEREDKANKCFTDNSCDAPDWDANPLGKAGGRGGKGMDMPKAVKDCLKKKIMDKVGAKMNDCLTRKGIKNLNFSALADMAQGTHFDLEGHEGEAKAGIEGMMKAKFNAVKAVDKCAQKKGGDPKSVRPLEQCLQDLKKGEKAKMCAFVKPCESKISNADCKKRGQDLMKALCQCKKEKEGEIAKKLQALGQSKPKVGIQELVNTVADDQDMDGMMKDVEKCYQDNNVQEPAMLKMAIALMSGRGAGNGPLSAAFSINGSTVVIMGDMMELDAKDGSECEPCP